MSTLPADVEVLEPVAGAFRERRFRLPGRTHAVVRQNYRDALVGAAALCMVPLAIGTFLALKSYLKGCFSTKPDFTDVVDLAASQ